MSIDHNIGKGYTPLPQSNTDTEGEDDHVNETNHFSKDYNHAPMSTINPIHDNTVYFPLDETRNLSNHAENGYAGFKYYRDDAPVLLMDGNTAENDLWQKKDMSPLRRFCLVFSILLCIVTIIGFLYVLPCDDSLVCPTNSISQKSSISWEESLQNVELQGPISIIPDFPYNLIFLVLGQKFKNNPTSLVDRQFMSSEGSGVISMQGTSGKFLWKALLKRSPTAIDCVTLDTDKSGKPDCIVVGEKGLLDSIQPTAGTINWSSKFQTFPQLPIILPDVDSDGVEDLLSVDIKNKDLPYLVILSGASGALLGEFHINTTCSDINIYNLITKDVVTFSCHDVDGKNVERSLSLKGILYKTGLLKNQRKRVLSKNGNVRTFETKKISEDTTLWKLTPYHYLSVINEGSCPGEACRVYANLTLRNSTNQSLIWNSDKLNTIASKPVPLKTLKQPYTAGFAIKFWQWNDTTINVPKTNLSVQHKIIEKVIIVIVNYTNVTVINANQNEIIQICQNNDCQPDLKYNSFFNSLAIASFDDDGIPELINYSSSYNTGFPKILNSKVQVVRLDSFVGKFLSKSV
ncbi:uncharacterized protein [Prorops nasuta]|uniref:uncharacterized protein isoform X2 n=1 Tax=Prorops nasuta TaxID=863751 RepID=UPI0034CFA422